MTTAARLEKLEQQLNKLSAKQAVAKLKERKADTRRKIEWGGLVIKSALHEFPKNIVLGAMLNVVERLTDNDFFYQCQQRGDAAFAEVNKIENNDT